jgi:glycosyltransferase involved in cell wall biosynthesis
MMSSPRVAYVTAGTAGMFCGSCLRDNALAAALREAGREVVLVPTFTPLRTEGEDQSTRRVFLGGVNLYLAEQWRWWRRLPAFLRRPFDHPLLLRAVSALALESRGDGDAALAVSLMQGTEGRQRREIEALVDWLAEDHRPHLVNVSNLLIAGFVPRLRARRDVPVLVTLQGDELFLDDVHESEREEVLAEMRRLARQVDGFVVFSRFYRDFMADLLRVPEERFHIVPLGLRSPESFRAPEPADAGTSESRPLTLRRTGFSDLRLAIGGWLGRADRPYFDELCRKLERGGAGDAYEHHALPDRASKIDFLHRLDVFSVPVTYPEQKGLYALEALAAGVPVVLPDAGVFPELLDTTGGGLRFAPGDVEGLAEGLRRLLDDRAMRRRLGREGQGGVVAHRGDHAMAEATWRVYEEYLL